LYKQEIKGDNGFLKILLKKFKSGVFKNISRPEDIPDIVPDCGWNHGEVSETNETIKPER